MSLKHREIDGLDYVVVPAGHVIYKAMATKGMTTEKMNDYLDSKGSPSISWFGELSNAKWYMKNWFENKGEIYQYEFLKEGLFLNITPKNINALANRFQKNKGFVKDLKCFSGVGMSQIDQFKQCAKKNIDDYPSKIRESRMSNIKDDEMKRYSFHDLDLKVSQFMCKNIPMDGYYSEDVRTDYGELPIFPLEFATCFAKGLLKVLNTHRGSTRSRASNSRKSNSRRSHSRRSYSQLSHSRRSHSSSPI